MDGRAFKEGLLKKCIAQQLEVSKQLQYEIDEAQKQANDYGQPKDRYDAYRTKLMRQIELFAKQMEKSNAVINLLQKVRLDKIASTVEFGALVLTNKQNIFVSAGLGKVEFEGEVFYAVSPQVPIYNALKGKKKGDEVLFNNNRFVIRDIF